MNCKKVVVLSLGLSMLLLTLTYSAVVRATPEEIRTVYEINSLGLEFSVVAPDFTYPGENITVTVRADASGGTAVEYIRVNIYGLRNETVKFPLEDIYIDTVPPSHQNDYVITIPNDTSPGLLYGIIEWGEWSVRFQDEIKVTITPPPAGFTVTYVKSLELEELQARYDELNATYYELNATYHSLLANYTKLENYKSELGSTRNLMYIFVATTVVSAATAFILLIRRPKRLWT